MSLNLNVINDLRDKRAEHVAKSAEMSAEARKFEQFAREFDAAIADLDKAIAALEPQTVEPALEWVEPPTADESVEALPSMDDIIDPDLTGGLQTEEHLDRLHAGTLPSAVAERTSDVSQAELVTEQTPSPEAAYAPVNDEGLMWSNGFEADAKAKAAEPAPEAKRPFWMFTKDPVDA
jgi:hypothetical protein